MYVCICHGVTEKDIKKAAKQGAQSLHDVKQMTGASSGCGSCADVALDILIESKQQTTPDFLQVIQPKLSIQTTA